MITLVIHWSEVGIKATQFILSLSLIVLVHELGHFIAARKFKCKVEQFFLFFDPWFALFRKKIGDTVYGIGWIPLGGYVKIAGMMEEGPKDKKDDEEKEDASDQPNPIDDRNAMYNKPAWQRLIVMSGGVVMNLLFGFLIYCMILWHWGDCYVSTANLPFGIATDSLARSIGLQDGDQIYGINGYQVEKFKNIPIHVILRGASQFNIKREDKLVNISIPEDFGSTLLKHRALSFISPRVPFAEIDSVEGTTIKGNDGLRKGDVIISVNNTPVYFHALPGIVRDHANQTVTLTALRGKDTLRFSLPLSKEGCLGVYISAPRGVINTKEVRYSFWQSIIAGFNLAKGSLENTILQLKLLVSGKVNPNESGGGIIMIANSFPAEWNWQSFWWLTGILSLIIAIVNLLPIPGLDGAHILFILYELIRGRKPSFRFLEYAHIAGGILLLLLMVYTIGLDIFQLLK